MNLSYTRHGKSAKIQTLSGVGGSVDPLSDIIIINNGGATANVVMPPAAAANYGMIIRLKRASSAASGTINLRGFGAEKVERSTGVFNNLYTWAAGTRNTSYVSDGVQWHMLHNS